MSEGIGFKVLWGQEFSNCFIFISTYTTVIYTMTKPPMYCSNEKGKQFNVQMFLERYSSWRGREILNTTVQGRAETSPLMAQIWNGIPCTEICFLGYQVLCSPILNQTVEDTVFWNPSKSEDCYWRGFCVWYGYFHSCSLYASYS